MGLLSKFRKTEKRATLEEDVFEHLTDLLNTKKNLGCYPFDYGIDSYVYLGTDKNIALQLAADIKSGLEQFEKRVRDIDIQPVNSENSFLLAFKISCKIEKNSYSFQLSFHNQKNMFKLETKS